MARAGRAAAPGRVVRHSPARLAATQAQSAANRRLRELGAPVRVAHRRSMSHAGAALLRRRVQIATRPWVVYFADLRVANPRPTDSSRVVGEYAAVEEAVERAIRFAEDGE